MGPEPAEILITKPWGLICRPWVGTNSYVDLIQIVAGGYSSIHRHRHNHNIFAVQSGILEIRIYSESATGQILKADSKALGPGDSLCIPPGQLHQFCAQEAVAAQEFYFSSFARRCDPEDIERFSENGVLGCPVSA